MRYLVLLAVSVAACGGAKAPAITPGPDRGLRALKADDPEITAIATVAARSLPVVSNRSSTPTLFAGVYVRDRESREATDAVRRTTGMGVGSTAGRVQMQCRAVSSSGQERTIPCPVQAAAQIPPTIIFDEVRATADSAYVGFTEAINGIEKANCMTLVWRLGKWTYLSSGIIAKGKNCGK